MVSNSMWPMTTMLDNVTLETDCILLNIDAVPTCYLIFGEMTTYLKIWLICTAGLIIQLYQVVVIKGENPKRSMTD